MAAIRILLRFWLILAAAWGLQTSAAWAEDLPVAFSAKVAGDTNTMRFFVNFDKSLRLKAFYMDAPYRIIIDLQEAKFQFEEGAEPAPRGLITDIRYGRISKGRSRIVLTLSSPVEIIKADIQRPLDQEHFRFVLDFNSTDEDRYAELLETQAREIGESGGLAKRGDRPTVDQSEAKPGEFTVVIDPGHGGIDGGATGRNGTVEKDIVLSVGLQVAQEIGKLGPYRILFTRDEDKFVSLRERVSFSRRAKADLFISIHADSLRQRFVRGATVYTLAKKASDRLSAELAASENAADLVAGLPAETDTDAVSDILADLTTRETKRFSTMFSRILVEDLDPEILLNKNPLRSAAFVVLKAPDVPGVLLELGYLSNKDDEKLLQKADWQLNVARAVATSVDRFFDLRKAN